MNAVRRRIAIVAAAAIAASVWSCMTAPTDSVGVKAPNNRASADLLGLHLLNCQVLDADSVTQEIGTEGGTLTVGPHQLVVPAGALDSTVSITAIAPSSHTRQVQFYPEGLTFNTPASLTLDYNNCGVVSALLPKSVVYVDGSLNILELISSLDSFSTKTVTGSIEHFSGYAVAW